MTRTTDLDDLLECVICRLRYNTRARAPKELPCRHIYCNLCLKSLPNHGNPPKIRCPLDEQAFTVEFVAALPPCRPLMDILTASYKSALNVCDKHPGQGVDAYCSMCAEAVCWRCAYDRHANTNHSVLSVTETARDARGAVELQTTGGIKSTLEALERSKQETRHKIDKVMARRKVVEGQVEEWASTIKRAVDVKRNDLLKQLDKATIRNTQALRKHVLKAELFTLKLEDVQFRLEEAVTEASDLDLLRGVDAIRCLNDVLSKITRDAQRIASSSPPVPRGMEFVLCMSSLELSPEVLLPFASSMYITAEPHKGHLGGNPKLAIDGLIVLTATGVVSAVCMYGPTDLWAFCAVVVGVVVTVFWVKWYLKLAVPASYEKWVKSGDGVAGAAPTQPQQQQQPQPPPFPLQVELHPPQHQQPQAQQR